MTKTSDPHFAERVRASFTRQNAMNLSQATLPVIGQTIMVMHGKTEK